MDWRNERLRRAQVGGADLDRIGSERKSCRDSASIANSARRDYRQAHGVAHLRQKRNQAWLCINVIGKEHAAMPARLASLRNNAVDSVRLEP